jgi:voltage-gated potassium channel
MEECEELESPSSIHWKTRLQQVIYESNTRAGKLFDIGLLLMIILSIVVVMLDSMEHLHEKYGTLFAVLEWTFTILFTIEYALRLIVLKYPIKFVFSFFGIIDLLAIIPTYLSIVFVGSQSLIVFRALRLLRIFRIFRLVHFLREMHFLTVAILNSLRKIGVFITFVLMLVVILGSIIYLVESDANSGFSSIPQSVYWAIVTITTVGYGDVAPVTTFGKFIASFIMLLGYGILAVPTGIVTTEMALAVKNKIPSNEACPSCGKEGHDHDAKYCKFCGGKL